MYAIKKLALNFWPNGKLKKNSCVRLLYQELQKTNFIVGLYLLFTEASGQNPRRPEFWGAWYGDTCRTTAYCIWHPTLWRDISPPGYLYKTVNLPFSAHNTELRKVKSPVRGVTNCTLYDLRLSFKKKSHNNNIRHIFPGHIGYVPSQIFVVPHANIFCDYSAGAVRKL